MVNKHAPCQIEIFVALNLEVNKNPGLITIQLGNPNQFICVTTPGLSRHCYFLKFLIEKLVALPPVYIDRNVRKKEFHELPEIFFYQFFPGGIVI